MPGAFKAVKKNGTVYYRSSITFRNKHISLGSYDLKAKAEKAYEEAQTVLYTPQRIEDYSSSFVLRFDKYICLINFRDNGVYIKNPVYLMNRFFLYYIDPDTIFKFDIDDLFFYSSHFISRKGGHFFVADYGMQININSRYGIRRHAVLNRDYRFINGDRFDYRYENIDIINRYFGVQRFEKKGKVLYRVTILVNGSYIVGTYETETEAAIAYNKAADLVTKRLPYKKYELNYIDSISPLEYAEIYTDLTVSPKLLEIKPGKI
ncbi:MAG: hypothetical protein IJ073_02275 [Lachnospiraceae bacterium]|nr:hypothetical protein [Lachnospiraceae bacterium]